jgi:hypothetical protein
MNEQAEYAASGGSLSAPFEEEARALCQQSGEQDETSTIAAIQGLLAFTGPCRCQPQPTATGTAAIRGCSAGMRLTPTPSVAHPSQYGTQPPSVAPL